mgnify:CR=1 FL=1
MKLDEFDYDLPEELIAQSPAEKRDQSRLLFVDRGADSFHHHHFVDLPTLLAPGDLLIMNDTKVIPARLYGKRETTGGKWEGLYLQSIGDEWELLCQTRGRLQPGECILIEPDLRLRLTRQDEGHWFAQPESDESTLSILNRVGSIPLPPYIRKGVAQDEDVERYQTLYAERAGAVAAPTAGLHFTEEVLTRLEERGIQRAFVTLHVGIGTFQPVKVDNISEHVMHQEWGELTQPTVDAIASCQGRVIAVGTTSVRVLETVAATGTLRPWSGMTDLFITPPYDFQVIQGLITNFHLPKSTLLMMIGALMGMETMRAAYQEAIANRYSFYSYGDAMLIV